MVEWGQGKWETTRISNVIAIVMADWKIIVLNLFLEIGLTCFIL